MADTSPLMGVQNSDAVAITGGTITGTTLNAGAIGGTTPAAGAFTTLSATGAFTGAAISGTNIAASGYVSGSVGNALTAVGNNRATSLALVAQVNNITTATASTGVTLPAVATVGIGAMVVIFNGGASAIQVYGAGSDTIDAAAATTGVALTNAKRCAYYAVAAATWVSAQLGVVSA